MIQLPTHINNQKVIAIAVIHSTDGEITADTALPAGCFGVAICQDATGRVHVHYCDKTWTSIKTVQSQSLDDAFERSGLDGARFQQFRLDAWSWRD